MTSDFEDSKPTTSDDTSRSSIRSGRRVPRGRVGRLRHFAGLAGGVAGSALAEGAKQWMRGNRPSAKDLLLTPANAKRLADRLSRMRGAALKLGQLLSMETADWLPPELAQILARLRENADPMPRKQLLRALEEAWGPGWQTYFETFEYQPFASASIGQVHRGQLTTGEQLAIKVQYPGVADSIDSDVDNIASLIKASGLLPPHLEIDRLLNDAKAQLRAEVDYCLEADYLKRYGAFLADDERFQVPSVFDEWSGQHVLAMQYLDSEPLEQIADLPADQKNRLFAALVELSFRELFEFRLMQTDPNFANYRYDRSSNALVLLDFGACRDISKAHSTAYLRLIRGALKQRREQMDRALLSLNLRSPELPEPLVGQLLDTVETACEPFLIDAEFDFAATDLPRRLREQGLVMKDERQFWHTPPADLLFIHRKIGGLFLLGARLQAKVNLHQLAAPYL